MKPQTSGRTSTTDTQNNHLLSRIKLIWEVVVAASVVPSIFLVTFQAVFNANLIWQWVLIYALDVLYVVSIVLRFMTGYKERGVTVAEQRRIALHYLKTFLIPDLLSVIPLELFAFASADTVCIAAFLRLNRCIRCYKVWTFLGKQCSLKLLLVRMPEHICIIFNIAEFKDRVADESCRL